MKINRISPQSEQNIKFKGKGFVTENIARNTSMFEDLDIIQKTIDMLKPENILSIHKSPTGRSAKSRIDIVLGDNLVINYNPAAFIDYQLYVSGGKDLLPEDLHRVGMDFRGKRNKKATRLNALQDALTQFEAEILKMAKSLCRRSGARHAEYIKK